MKVEGLDFRAWGSGGHTVWLSEDGIGIVLVITHYPGGNFEANQWLQLMHPDSGCTRRVNLCILIQGTLVEQLTQEKHGLPLSCLQDGTIPDNEGAG